MFNIYIYIYIYNIYIYIYIYIYICICIYIYVCIYIYTYTYTCSVVVVAYIHTYKSAQIMEKNEPGSWITCMLHTPNAKAYICSWAGENMLAGTMDGVVKAMSHVTHVLMSRDLHTDDSCQTFEGLTKHLWVGETCGGGEAIPITTCTMTHSDMWRDTWLCVTWLIYE